MFRAEGVPVYGHVGFRFDARSAQLVQELRDRRFKDTFDKILLRCSKQIQDDVQLGKTSSIFVVPDTLYGDLTPYLVRDVVEYLLVALREDRLYTVVQVNSNTLYIRWSRPAEVSRPPPPIEFKQSERRQYRAPPPSPAAKMPPKITYKYAGGGSSSSASNAQKRGSDDIDKLLASLNL